MRLCTYPQFYDGAPDIVKTTDGAHADGSRFKVKDDRCDVAVEIVHVVDQQVHAAVTLWKGNGSGSVEWSVYGGGMFKGWHPGAVEHTYGV